MTEAPRLLLPRYAWAWLFWAQVAGVTALMLAPHPPQAFDTGWDKVNHLLAFAGPAFAGLAALRRPSRAAVAGLCLGLLAWGAVLEGLQSLLPPRRAELADLAADGAGILCGALLCLGLRRALSPGRR